MSLLISTKAENLFSDFGSSSASLISLLAGILEYTEIDEFLDAFKFLENFTAACGVIDQLIFTQNINIFLHV